MYSSWSISSSIPQLLGRSTNKKVSSFDICEACVRSWNERKRASYNASKYHITRVFGYLRSLASRQKSRAPCRTALRLSRLSSHPCASNVASWQSFRQLWCRICICETLQSSYRNEYTNHFCHVICTLSKSSIYCKALFLASCKGLQRNSVSQSCGPWQAKPCSAVVWVQVKASWSQGIAEFYTAPSIRWMHLQGSSKWLPCCLKPTEDSWLKAPYGLVNPQPCKVYRHISWGCLICMGSNTHDLKKENNLSIYGLFPGVMIWDVNKVMAQEPTRPPSMIPSGWNEQQKCIVSAGLDNNSISYLHASNIKGLPAAHLQTIEQSIECKNVQYIPRFCSETRSNQVCCNFCRTRHISIRLLAIALYFSNASWRGQKSR